MVTSSPPHPSEASLGLAVDHYNRYPGELATLFVRFVPPEGEAVLQVSLPRVMQLESYRLPDGIAHNLAWVNELPQDLVLNLPLKDHFPAGQAVEVSLQARIQSYRFDHFLITTARLVGAEGQTLIEESVQVAVYGQGKYLKYLPEIYSRDDFTSRFLMLFESFWKPISRQVDQLYCNFDPKLTPEAFVPWLASWVGMPVESSIPLERMRRLVGSSMLLFQCRGTRQALKTYLEIFTGGEVVIAERRARNFTLGGGSALGVEIALGRENRPNTLSIQLRIPSAELERTRFSAETYQRKVSEVARAWIPAHVTYEVQCEFIPTA